MKNILLFMLIFPFFFTGCDNNIKDTDYVPPENLLGEKKEIKSSKTLRSVIYNGKVFVAAGSDGIILVSKDKGHKWKKANIEANIDISSLAYNRDSIFAAGELGVIFFSANNGESWKKITTKKVFPITCVIALDKKCVAVGRGGNILLSNDSGSSWAEKESGTENNLIHTVFNNNRIIAVGEKGTLLLSIDGGENWEKKELGVDARLNCAAFSDKIAIVVGEEGCIFVSEDNGVKWERKKAKLENETSKIDEPPKTEGLNKAENSVVQDDSIENGGNQEAPEMPEKSKSITVLRSVVFNKTKAVGIAVGDNGIVLVTQDDGNQWIVKETGITENLCKVLYEDGKIIAAGEKGSIIMSTDLGKTWKTQKGKNDLYGLAYKENIGVAVGAGGSIWLLKEPAFK